MTVYSEDRNVFPDKDLVHCGTNSSGNLSASLSKDSDATVSTTHTGGSTLSINTWYYVVYSFLMTNGHDTTIELFLDNASDGST